MPLRCSCGAILPEDARFCHKCGAPQFDEDIARLKVGPAEAAASPEPPKVPPFAATLAPSPIGFGNGRAVRITLAVAGCSLFALYLIALLAPPLVFPIMVAAGFTSVRIYISRTAENLTPSGGAVLGAMTWLWLFLVEAFATAGVLLTAQGREMMKSTRPEMAQLAADPQKLFVMIGAGLVIGAVSAAVGGILAVRLQPRGGSSSH